MADSIRKNRSATTSKTTGPTEATPAARTVAIYRTQLADLLAQAETAAQDGSAAIHFDVGRLVERLCADLIRLYDDSQRGALAKVTGLLYCQRLSPCAKYCAMHGAAHAHFVTRFTKRLGQVRAALCKRTWLEVEA